MEFTGILKGPGLPDAGERTGFRIGKGHLHFYLRDGRIGEIPLRQLRLGRADGDADVWEIGWDDPDGPFLVPLDNLAVQRQLLDDPPPGLKGQLAALRRGGVAPREPGARRPKVVLLLAALLLALCLALVNADYMAGWAARYVGPPQEQALGDAMFAVHRRQLRLLEDTPANAALAALGTRLTAGSQLRWRWAIALDATPSAYSMPGGTIVVHTGLFEWLEDAEELAGVLAHLVAHVEQRHSMLRLADQSGVALLVALATGDRGGVAQLAADTPTVAYDNSQEGAADAAAVVTLARAGVAPGGLLRVLQRLRENSKTWSTMHPATPARLLVLENAVGEAGDDFAAPPVDWAATQASIARSTGR